MWSLTLELEDYLFQTEGALILASRPLYTNVSDPHSVKLSWQLTPAAPRLCCEACPPGLQENPSQRLAFTQLPHGTGNCFNSMALLSSKSPQRSCHVIILFAECCYNLITVWMTRKEEPHTTEGTCAASSRKIHLVSIWCCTNVRCPTSESDLFVFHSLLFVICLSY